MEYIVEFRVVHADDGYVWQFQFQGEAAYVYPSRIHTSKRPYKTERVATAAGLKALDEELQRRRSRLKQGEAP